MPTSEEFAGEIFLKQEPVIFKAAMADSPLVHQRYSQPPALLGHLKDLLGSDTIPVSFGKTGVYPDQFVDDLNLVEPDFTEKSITFAELVDLLLKDTEKTDGDIVRVISQPIREFLPGLLDYARLPLLDVDSLDANEPRLWMGNQAFQVATHYDDRHNLHFLVAGNKEITLFPLSELPNMYVGPLDVDKTIATVPVSLARFDQPDFERYSKFRQALAHAQIARIGPGDVLFIPANWWHAVRPSGFNMAITYWWFDVSEEMASTMPASFLLALLAFRDAPQHWRELWRAKFDYFVFHQSGNPYAHLPGEQGLAGIATPESTQTLKTDLDAMMRSASLAMFNGADYLRFHLEDTVAIRLAADRTIGCEMAGEAVRWFVGAWQSFYHIAAPQRMFDLSARLNTRQTLEVGALLDEFAETDDDEPTDKQLSRKLIRTTLVVLHAGGLIDKVSRASDPVQV